MHSDFHHIGFCLLTSLFLLIHLFHLMPLLCLLLPLHIPVTFLVCLCLPHLSHRLPLAYLGSLTLLPPCQLCQSQILLMYIPVHLTLSNPPFCIPPTPRWCCHPYARPRLLSASRPIQAKLPQPWLMRMCTPLAAHASAGGLIQP